MAFACLWAGGFLAAVVAAAADQAVAPVEVHLQAATTATYGALRLGDVADLRGGSDAVSARLRQVELLTIDASTREAPLSQRYINLRLQLAGFTATDYRLSGPHTVCWERHPHRTWTDAQVEHHVQSELAKLLAVPTDELRVSLSAPLMMHLPEAVAASSGAELDIVPRGRPGLGSVTMLIRWLDGERLIAARAAQFDVARETVLLVAAGSLPRGQVLTADLVREERRWQGQAPPALPLSELVGRTLASALADGAVVESRHLQPRAATPLAPPVIQARDAVRVVARGRGLVVTLRAAEALQSGRPGQLIRCRNVETQQVIVAKVVAAGEVELAWD